MKKISITLFIITTLLPALAPAVSPDTLNEEQSRFAKKMEEFTEKTERMLFEAIAGLNNSKDVETKTFEVDTADYIVKVARGSVVEKGGFMKVTVKKALGYTKEPLWNRFIQINLHPKTPLVPFAHLTMNFVYQKDGNHSISGIADMTPGTIIEEDVAFVKGEMEKLFKKHGVDITPYRAPLLKGNHKDWLKAACVGVSFYSRPLTINEKNFDLIKESIETFLDAYLKILAKRKDQKFSEKDIAAMFDMRKRLLEKDFLWDPYTSKGLVPYKVWSFQMSPPEVRF